MLPGEVENSLLRLFEKEFRLLEQLTATRSTLAARFDFSLHRIFQRLAGEGRSGIEAEQLNVFLHGFGRLTPEEDIVALLRRFD